MQDKAHVLVLYRSEAEREPTLTRLVEALYGCAPFRLSFMDVSGHAAGLIVEPFDGLIVLPCVLNLWAMRGEAVLPPEFAAYSGVWACILQKTADTVASALCRIIGALRPQLAAAPLPEAEARAVYGAGLAQADYVPLGGEEEPGARSLCAALTALLPARSRARLVWGMCGVCGPKTVPEGGGYVPLRPTGSLLAFARQEAEDAPGGILWQRFARENLFAVPSNFIKRAKLHNKAFRIRDFLPVEPAQKLLPACAEGAQGAQVRDALWN